jgi:hypothetical protein
MSPGDAYAAKIYPSQKVNRVKSCMRIGFAPSLHVAARICFSRRRKIQKLSMSRSHRLTTRRHLRPGKRSGSKINCPGLSSTRHCRHSRRARKLLSRDGSHGQRLQPIELVFIRADSYRALDHFDVCSVAVRSDKATGDCKKATPQTERSDYRTPASTSRLVCNRSCPHAASMS